MDAEMLVFLGPSEREWAAYVKWNTVSQSRLLNNCMDCREPRGKERIEDPFKVTKDLRKGAEV